MVFHGFFSDIEKKETQVRLQLITRQLLFSFMTMRNHRRGAEHHGLSISRNGFNQGPNPQENQWSWKEKSSIKTCFRYVVIRDHKNSRARYTD